MTQLLDTKHYQASDIAQLWAYARAIKQRGNHRCRNLLTDQTIVHLFYEASTRTAQSFHLASQHLGAISLLPHMAHSAVHKGESLIDTALTFVAMGASTITLRHPDRDSVATLAQALPEHVHLINAGNGDDQHPTQALLDLWTLDEAGLDWSQAKIAIIGDGRHSRVVHAWCDLLPTLGVRECHFIAPAGWQYKPANTSLRSYYHTRIPEGIADCDVILTLRQQTERWSADLKPLTAGHAFCLTQADLLHAKPDVKILHPGPVMRDKDLQSALLNHPGSLIAAQVTHGVILRMAILCQLYQIPITCLQSWQSRATGAHA